jgi:hypothetical protein
MATVDKNVNGMPIQKYMAFNAKVQKALDVHMHGAKARATFELSIHNYDGIAYIDVSRDRADRLLHLVDTRSGTPGAMTIEFGRKPDPDRYPTGPPEGVYGAMSGLYILHGAVYARYKHKQGRKGHGPQRPNPTRRKAIYD